MNFAEAMAYILGFTDFERNPDQALAPIHYNIERVRQLLRLLGNPEGRFRSIHVAGTKGKGSTAAMIANSLKCAGFRTGFFSSPHLHSFTERIRVGGEQIGEEEFCHSLEQVKPVVQHLARELPGLGAPTTFEVTTALAFQHFADCAVDVAVLEAGLGGRLDATNVVDPLVAVITSISLDHTQVLGESIAEIAREKAGIIKRNGIVVSAPQTEEAITVIRNVAEENDATLLLVGRDWTWEPCGDGRVNAVTVSGPFGRYDTVGVPLLGEHQLVNATTAIAALEALRFRGLMVSAEHVRSGIAGVRWPGRMEVLADRPVVLVDGAHNSDSARKLSSALRAAFPDRRLVLVIGTSVDKDISGMLQELAPWAAHVIVTRSAHPRSAQPGLIAEHAAAFTGNLSVSPNVRLALSAAREIARPDDVICVTGSLFVVAEAREAMGLAENQPGTATGVG